MIGKTFTTTMGESVGGYISGKPVMVQVIGKRKPRKGDLYLSGARREVWYAPNDLNHSQEMFIVKILSKPHFNPRARGRR